MLFHPFAADVATHDSGLSQQSGTSRNLIRRHTQGDSSETRTDCANKSPAGLHSALWPLDELFLGPANGSQCPTDRRLRDINFELIPQEYYHLIKVLAWLFKEVFAKSIEHGQGHRSRAAATIRGCSSAAEASKVGAYGFNGASAVASNLRNRRVCESLPNKRML
jgi:hypothetical protein